MKFSVNYHKIKIMNIYGRLTHEQNMKFSVNHQRIKIRFPPTKSLPL